MSAESVGGASAQPRRWAKRLSRIIHTAKAFPFTFERSSSRRNGAFPINSLPDELIGEVFLQYLQPPWPIHDSPFLAHLSGPGTGPRLSVYNDGKEYITPIVLGGVCSRWRAISLSLPGLWATIQIHDPEPDDIPLLELWLQRSHSVLLDVTFVDTKMNSASRSHTNQQITQAIFNQSHRWRRICLCVPAAFIGNAWRGIVVPHLRSFDFRIVETNKQIMQPLTSTLCSSPELEEAVVQDASHYTPGPMNPKVIPWCRLRSITVTPRLTSQDVIGILQGCPLLERCIIERLLGLDSFATTPPITFTRLQHFATFAIEGQLDIFDCLTLPDLQTLYVDLAVRPRGASHGRDCWTILANFGTRSECQLQSFSFSVQKNRELHPEELCEYWTLPMLSSITQLAMHSKTSYRSLETLMITWTRFPLPNLQQLYLGSHDDFGGRPDLNSWIANRTTMYREEKRLRRVRAEMYSPLDSFKWERESRR